MFLIRLGHRMPLFRTSFSFQTFATIYWLLGLKASYRRSHQKQTAFCRQMKQKDQGEVQDGFSRQTYETDDEAQFSDPEDHYSVPGPPLRERVAFALQQNVLQHGLDVLRVVMHTEFESNDSADDEMLEDDDETAKLEATSEALHMKSHVYTIILGKRTNFQTQSRTMTNFQTRTQKMQADPTPKSVPSSKNTATT